MAPISFGLRMRTRTTAPMISAAQTRRHDLTGVSGVGCDLGSGFAGVEGSSLSLSLSLSLCASDPEMVWSENFYFKPFPRSKPYFTRSTSNTFRKIYFPCVTKHPHLRKSIFRSNLKPKQTQVLIKESTEINVYPYFIANGTVIISQI